MSLHELQSWWKKNHKTQCTFGFIYVVWSYCMHVTWHGMLITWMSWIMRHFFVWLLPPDWQMLRSFDRPAQGGTFKVHPQVMSTKKAVVIYRYLNTVLCTGESQRTDLWGQYSKDYNWEKEHFYEVVNINIKWKFLLAVMPQMCLEQLFFSLKCLSPTLSI